MPYWKGSIFYRLILPGYKSRVKGLVVMLVFHNLSIGKCETSSEFSWNSILYLFFNNPEYRKYLKLN